MAQNVTRLFIWVHVEINEGSYLLIDYTPVAGGSSPGEESRKLHEYEKQFRTPLEQLQPALRDKLSRLGEYAISALDVPDISIEDTTIPANIRPRYYQVQMRAAGPWLHLAYHLADGDVTEKDVAVSDATRRLIENIWPMCEQLAWDHLHRRFEIPRQPISKRKVFLSYRKGDQQRTDFVKAIADRIGKEGFLPWFDEWDIVAGDSLAREIADGLKEAYAIIIVLTPDYPDGKWAREEMENAITQRVERNIKVIPVLFEPCERSELLRALTYVDCTSHEPDLFERQFLKIIDALNELDLNPYRR